MDEYIRESFLNCLKISVNDKQMPMDSSQFYSNHMLKCKRENIEIDLKNSTFKKISKFFQVMDKEGFIEYKEAKKGTNPMIT
jgi:translation initiation factor 2D